MRRTVPSRLTNFWSGVIALFLVALGCWFAFGMGNPFRDPYTVKVAFRSANNLRADSAVRVAGVDVGKVTKVEHVSSGEDAALVEMEIDEKGLPLYRDARFEIRPRILLEGNFFVEVRPGTARAGRLDDGGIVPVSQASGPVQLNQAIEPLKSDNRKHLQTLLREAGEAFKGGGEGFNRSLRYWRAAYRDTAVVSGALEPDLARFMRAAGRVTAAIDEDPAALKSLIADLDTTAASFARESEALDRSLAELPPLLREAQPAFASLNAAFPALRELAADLRPGVRAAGPALAASVPFVRQLRELMQPDELGGLTQELEPVVPLLAELANLGEPLLEELRPATSCGAEVLLPWANDKIEDAAFPAHGPVYTELPKTFGGVGGESKSGDANGQWVRVLFGIGNYAYPREFDQFMFTTQPLMGVNPPPPDKRPPFRPDVPCETQETPDLRTTPLPPPEGFKVDTSSAAARALTARGLEPTTEYMRVLLDRPGLRRLRVTSDRVLRSADVPKLERAEP